MNDDNFHTWPPRLWPSVTPPVQQCLMLVRLRAFGRSPRRGGWPRARKCHVSSRAVCDMWCGLSAARRICSALLAPRPGLARMVSTTTGRASRATYHIFQRLLRLLSRVGLVRGVASGASGWNQCGRQIMEALRLPASSSSSAASPKTAPGSSSAEAHPVKHGAVRRSEAQHPTRPHMPPLHQTAPREPQHEASPPDPSGVTTHEYE